jgi:hypothetical protein
MENDTIAVTEGGEKKEKVRSVDVGPDLKGVLSIDEEPDLKGNMYLGRSLQENFVVKQAIKLWQGPKYPAYCSLT